MRELLGLPEPTPYATERRSTSKSASSSTHVFSSLEKEEIDDLLGDDADNLVVRRAFAGHLCCCGRPAMLFCQRANDALANSSSGLIGAFAFRRLARETTRKPMTRMMNSTVEQRFHYVFGRDVD